MPPNINTQHRHSVRRSSLRTTLFFESFALLALTVIGVSIVAFFLSWSELKTKTISQLQSIAEGKEALLESTVSRQREQLSVLGHDPELRNLPSVTALIGFRQLLRIDADGSATVIAGDQKESSFMNEFTKSVRGTEGTAFRPIVTDAGWTMYVITAPQISGSTRIGTLVATFDAAGLASRILHTDSAAKTTEVLLATTLEGSDIILRSDDATERVVPVQDAGNGTLSVVREALSGKEGVAETIDYSGISVLAAYRSIPTLGWAVIAKVDRYEVEAPTLRIATNLAGTGFLLIIFLSLFTFVVGRRIVGPLEELTKKLDGLEARHWHFRRSIFTGNELETVDGAADELTNRLRTSHEHLESIVAERTKELQKQHAQDAAILQGMDDGLIVTDASGIVTYVNHMAQMLAGTEGGEGKAAHTYLAISDKNEKLLNAAEHPIMQVLQSGTAFHPSADPQLIIKKPDGSQTALQIRVTPILRGKQCIGTVSIIRDITDERRIDHMKSEFISLVSHQLRTPLSSMRWYLEMLIADDAGPLTEDQREYVSQVAISNARMVHLVNALLNVSKIELGKFQISPETIDLQKLIQNAALSFDLELKQKKISFAFEMPSKDISIRSDKSLLELIIENFLSNAIKYSHPESTVHVRVSEDRTARTALLSITDTGIGIPEIQKELIGHKLFRGQNAKISDTDGNGLGLYISLIAAETIGAKLTFESTENKGTTFSLLIPLDPKEK